MAVSPVENLPLMYKPFTVHFLSAVCFRLEILYRSAYPGWRGSGARRNDGRCSRRRGFQPWAAINSITCKVHFVQLMFGISTSASCSLSKGATCMNRPSARTGGDGG